MTQSCSQLHSVPFEPWALLYPIYDLLSPSILPTAWEAAPSSFSAFLWNQLSALLLLGMPHQAPSQTPPVSRFSSFPRERGVFLSLEGPASLKSLREKQLNSEQIRKPNSEQQARNGLWLVPVTGLWSWNQRGLRPGNAVLTVSFSGFAQKTKRSWMEFLKGHWRSRELRMNLD